MESQRVTNICLVILSVIAVTGALIYTKDIMIPFVLAIFVTFMVLPTVDFFSDRLKFPRPLAIFATGLTVLGGITLISFFIVSSVQGGLQNMDAYRERIVMLAGRALRFAEDLGFESPGLSPAELGETLRALPIFNWFRAAAGTMVDFITNSSLVIIFVLFLITGQSLGLGSSPLWAEIDKKVRTYIVTKVIASFATGLLTGIILALLGLDMAFMFGVLAFLLNFIPNVGSLVAMVLPVPVALLQFESLWVVGAVVALPGFVQLIIGNVIEPKLMGDALDLHPVTLLLFLMFWGLIWGVPGMFLAAPIAVIIKIVLSDRQDSGWLANLMAGRI